MNTASSNPPSTRPARRALTALDTLERLAQYVAVRSAHGAGAVNGPHPSRLGSGVYRLDEFAGIERLDRAELDETDEG